MSSGNKSFVLICTVISILALLIAGVNISRLFQIEKSSDINENSPQSEDVEEQFDVRNVSTTSIDISPKTIDFGVIVAFMMYIKFFTRPLMQIAQSFTGIQSAAAASAALV